MSVECSCSYVHGVSEKSRPKNDDGGCVFCCALVKQSAKLVRDMIKEAHKQA